MSQNLLLITPPFTQLNTPYPATAYLKGFLNTQNIASTQCDLGIETILKLFSAKGLSLLFARIASVTERLSPNATRMYNLRHRYIHTIDDVIGFLQGKNPILAHAVCDGLFLPEASRFSHTDDLDWAFGTMGINDKAKHLCTLYLEDISDLIVEAVDPHFGFSRYAEQLGRSASEFDALYQALQQPASLIDELLIDLLQSKIDTVSPTMVALSVPFPGNLFAAFRCGQWLKTHRPEIQVVMGGGFANTELRLLAEPRVFEFVDYITLDDGERPILNLIDYLNGNRDISTLKRTFTCRNGSVTWIDGSTENDIPQSQAGTPDYSDFDLNNYLSVIEMANPMHRLWSDGRWNKITLAHGCYWGRCTFCDTSLDYIGRYEANTAQALCDRIETIHQQTGHNGFHFVDEAAPPALLKALALEILNRNLNVVWWTNVRFEKSFTADVCYLLKAAGCIAVSGGLEVASDRLLGIINKGVSVSKVASVTHNFTEAGIMVHAYLMYGFPTQTVQETIDSLEMVRQLFEANVIQSAYWHRFALTTHSPVGRNAKKYSILIQNEKPGTFANNDLIFTDQTGVDHDIFSEGLRVSLYNFMHGVGFDIPLGKWFNTPMPEPTVVPDFIQNAIETNGYEKPGPNTKIVWLGPEPRLRYFTKTKRNRVTELAELTFSLLKEDLSIVLRQNEANWLAKTLSTLDISHFGDTTFANLEKSYNMEMNDDFFLFWNQPPIQKLRNNGLLVL